MALNITHQGEIKALKKQQEEEIKALEERQDEEIKAMAGEIAKLKMQVEQLKLTMQIFPIDLVVKNPLTYRA